MLFGVPKDSYIIAKNINNNGRDTGCY
jgi:hypothetical protein